MEKIKKWRRFALATLALLFTAVLSFALVQVIPASAASYTLTVYGSEGGKVEVDGQTLKNAEESRSVTVTKYGELVEVKATPNEGYSFAYWYNDDDNTPLTGYKIKDVAYSSAMSYYVNKNANLHPKFIKNEDYQIPKVVADSKWSTSERNYTFSSSDQNQFKRNTVFPITIESVGADKWYSVSLTVTAKHGELPPPEYGTLNITDGSASLLSYAIPTGTSEQPKTVTFSVKTIGDGYHNVKIEYEAPSWGMTTDKEKDGPTKLDLTLNFSEKTKAEVFAQNETFSQEVRFPNSNLGEVYYLEGIGVADTFSAEEIKSTGTKIGIQEGTATIAFHKNVPVVFYAIEKDGPVNSTIDPQQEVSIYNGGIRLEREQFQMASSSDTTSNIALSFTGENVLLLETNPKLKKAIYENDALFVDIREYALLPEVSYTTTVNGQDGTHGTLGNGGTVPFDYSNENTILVEIASANNVKEQSFTITRNGESQEYQDMQGRFGFPLNNVKERQEISILPDYGTRFYFEQPFAFTINMTIEGGEQKVISSASDSIEVTPDAQEPWLFDPAYNGENNLYAFSSRLTYVSGVDPSTNRQGKISQLGFTFTGKGQFYLEFNLLGGQGTNATAIGYAIGEKAVYSSSNTFQMNQGFADVEKSGINGLGYCFGSDPVKFLISNNDIVKELGGGWYSFALPIETTEETTLWFVHGYGSNISRNPEDRVTIRNVAFYSGDSYADWGVQNTKGEDNSTAGSVTVMKGKESATAGAVTPGTVLTFTANPIEKNSFYGWKLITGTIKPESESKLQHDDPQITDSDINWDTEGAKFISYEPTCRHIVGSGYAKIVAVIDTTGTYAVRHGDTFYAPDKVTEAFIAATTAEDKNVIVVDNVELSGITVPAKVNFVLPFNASGSYYEMGTAATATKYISWAEDVASADKEKHDKYKTPVYTLTLNGANTVKGNFYVGGVIHYPDQSAQGHTSGAYSELVLNGTITVGKDGMMDVYGRVTGRGGITVQSGATLKQPFLILDFAGGNNTYGLFDADQTPFKRYAMINIQCGKGYTIEYGGELIGHASLFFSGAITTLDQPFISYVEGGTTTLINLKKDATATAVYTDDRFVAGGGNTANIGHTTITITGGATAGYMDFVGMVQTSGVAFSIPYNYSLVLKSGDYSFDYPYKLMPGASLTAEKDATLDLNSEFYVYDGLVQSAMSGKWYPTASALDSAGYKTNAQFIVNGTLNVNSTATFFGVVQTTDTTGAATINVKKDATLAGKIVDGGLTIYDCNYMEYASSMRLYDKVHKLLTPIPVGEDGKAQKQMTFTSTYSGSETFELPAVSLKYESKDFGSSNAMNGIVACYDKTGDDGKCDFCQEEFKAGNTHYDESAEHKEHEESSTWKDGATEKVTGLTGSWKLEHDEHHYDWTITEDEKDDSFFGGANHATTERGCQELGCSHTEEKTLYKNVGEFAAQTYRGTAFTAEELFVKLYGEKGAFQKAVLGNGAETMMNAETHSITVTLDGAKGYFVVNGAFSETATFTFRIDQFNVAHLNQETIKSALSGFVYDGTAKTAELTLQAEGLTGSVEHKAFRWAKNVNAGDGTASVTIEGSGQNFTGTLTISFSIAKAEVTITVTQKEKDYDGTAYGDIASAVQDRDFTVTAGKIYSQNGKADFTVKLTVFSPAKDVAAYTVNATAEGQGIENYTIQYVAGTYEIKQKALEVTIDAVSHSYGEAKAALTMTLSGEVSGEAEQIKAAIKLSTEAEQWTDVGSYKISAQYSEGAGILKNYKVTVKNEENKAYTVKPKSIVGQDGSFSVTTAYTYDKTAKTPIMSDIKVEWEGYRDSDHAGLSAQFAKFTAGGYRNNIDAGEATAVLTASGNFEGQVTIRFNIAKATVDSVTVEGEYAYNGSALHPVIVVKSGSLTLTAEDYTVSYRHSTKQDTEVKNAGEYTVTIALTEACKNYQLGEAKTATFSVAKAGITITADNQHTPKGEPILSGDALTWTVTKTDGGKGDFFEEDRETLKALITVTTDAKQDTVKSDYTITIAWKGVDRPENYEVTLKNGTYSVDDTIWKNVRVTGDGTIKYDGTAHKLTVAINNDTLSKTTITQTIGEGKDPFSGATDVGTYVVNVTITAEGYTSSFTGEYTITITARKVTVTYDPASSAYGNDVATNFTYQTSGDTVLDGDSETFKAAIAAAKPHTDATNKSTVGGSYKITSEKPVLTNYDVTIKDGVYTITARPVDVTVKKQSVTYNQKEQSASSAEQYWSVADLADGEEASVLSIVLKASGTDAKAYDITASWTNDNYAVTFKGADGLTVEGTTIKNGFVINAAALSEATVTGSYTYNGNEQTPKFTVKAGDLDVAESDFELAFAADADRVSAGTVKVTVRAKSGNYSGSLERSFEIGAKKIKVTLKTQSVVYSGAVPTPDSKAYTVEEGGLCSRNGKEDDLGVTITLVNGKKDVGEYGLTAKASNTDYEVEFDTSAKLNITKKSITVKADDLSSAYGDEVKELTYTAVGLIEGEDPKTELHITLQPERTIKEVGTYAVTGTGTATNYSFEVAGGTYTVEKREVTVKILDRSALYDGTEPSVLQGQGEGWTVVRGSIIDGDNLHIVLTKAEGVNAGDYAIDGVFENDNYKVTFEGAMGTAGKYTVKPRAVTVSIYDQNATYDYEKAKEHSYEFNAAAWIVVANAGDGLASTEESSVLGIVLSVGELGNAGKYAITGSASNKNYAVTFTGSYESEGEENGKAGTYTIAKLDVSDEVIFMLLVGEEGDEGATEGDRTVRVKYAGKPLALACDATLFLYEEFPLKTSLDHTSIEEIGKFEVTVTIEDVNYCGSTVFTVIVTDANGYTQHLKDVLALLETLEGELHRDEAGEWTVTVEDYETLVEIYNALAGLDEAEQEVGAAELATYRAYVDAWEEFADIDDVIETAEEIADAPIATLFEAVAALTALAGLAYIAFKGGML